MPQCMTETGLACGSLCHRHCEFGRAQYLRMMKLFDGKTPKYLIEKLWDELQDEWDDHAVEVHHVPDTRKKTTPNGKYKGPFAFTLNMSPSDGLSKEAMITAVKKVMAQQSQPVKRYAWYLEYGDVESERHPHIHGMYETESQRRIEAKHWKRAWPIWDETNKLGQGHRGGYHRPVNFEDAYDKYIAKQQIYGESKL